MILSQTALVLIGLLLAGWTLAAGWAILAARGKARRVEAQQVQARKLARMVDESPAVPLLVRADGKIEAPPRLAGWLGLDGVPQYLTELDAGDKGLTAEQLAELTTAVLRTQKTAAPFRMVATPRGSKRSLALRGHLADPQVSPGGAALVWVFDFSDSESEMVKLRAEASRARGDFTALVSLIEAAPMPMWFRGPDGALRLVNSAYVTAVGGDSAEAVVGAGTELVEPVEGVTATQVALQAAAQNVPVERSVSATIGGQRRALRVSDLPLGDEGIAGYAVDIEDMEVLARSFRAFREAQRSMLDQLSAGVAQFSPKRQLVFANLPFQRQFALGPAVLTDQPPFERLLDLARDNGRVPEARDFPAWRREKAGWFAASEAQEEAWVLGDGTHLRIVAQPMPDGGLLLIAEDRTEQLRLSATRDTLLRTRTATFDSLYESVAVFAPDGRMQLWNRRFARDWELDAEFLDTHPHVEVLLERIAARLQRPQLVKSVGDAVRSATLDRKQAGGRSVLADGRTLRFTGVPLPDGNGLLAVLDITDTQKAETALKERNVALIEADAIKTRFLANMSYEFRTPLTSIGGFAELLQAGIGGDLSEQGQEYIAAILSSVERLGEQIEFCARPFAKRGRDAATGQRRYRTAALRHPSGRGEGPAHSRCRDHSRSARRQGRGALCRRYAAAGAGDRASARQCRGCDAAERPDPGRADPQEKPGADCHFRRRSGHGCHLAGPGAGRDQGQRRWPHRRTPPGPRPAARAPADRGAWRDFRIVVRAGPGHGGDRRAAVSGSLTSDLFTRRRGGAEKTHGPQAYQAFQPGKCW